jgi:hypothetical protein
MSLIKNVYPQNDAFTRNPIVISVSAPTLATYKVYADNNLMFTGNGMGDFTVNISEILETVFSETDEPSGNAMLLMFAQYNSYTHVRFEVSTTSENTETVNMLAWKGGINKTDYRYLRNQGTDIFSAKFRNYSGNFFFTTRTYGWTIAMKETELEPLAFIMPVIFGEELGYIRVKETVTGRSVRIEGASGAFMALNMEAVRKHFYVQYGVLANLFDVMDPYHSGRIACRIAIEEAPGAQERCAVRFLNSFGVYERIDLIGKATIQLTGNQNEDTIFQVYDEATDSFTKKRVRIPIGSTYKIQTGIKRGDELAFIQDMLASDSVYLALPDQEIKVIPSFEQATRAYVQTEPESMDITFKPVEDESNMSPRRTKYGTTRPRIFTSVFSEQFN